MTYAEMLLFCNTDKTNDSLMTPWARGGKYYATDARIGIVVYQKPDGWVDVDPVDRPSLQAAFDMHGQTSDPRPAWEQPPAPEFQPCGTCEKITRITCPHCKAEFKTCDKCDECGGIGKIEKPLIIRCFGGLYDIKYLRLVASLPCVTVREPKEAYNPARFEFEGGEGLVMPMSPKPSAQNIRDPLGVKP